MTTQTNRAERLSRLEKCWAQIKERLRTAPARTQEALQQGTAEVVQTVSSWETRGWFALCGYGREPV